MNVLLPSSITNPAIQAFQNEDPTASKEFHKKLTDEPHQVNKLKKKLERIVEATIQGGVTGVVTTCMVTVVIWNCASSILVPDKLSSLIMIVTFAVLVASGFSLAFNDYLKKQEYAALYNREKRREKWECDNYIEGEQKEMVELYKEKGLSHVDAEAVIRILSKDKSFFVDVMMKEELQMIQPDESISPLQNALLLFFSHLLFGLTPLIPFSSYLLVNVWEFTWSSRDNPFIISVLIGLLSLLVGGAAKSSFTVTGWWKSSIQLVAHGCVVIGIVTIITSKVSAFL